MNNYFLIAVGGTGARVAQSVVALAAAGLPAELGVGILDSSTEQATDSVSRKIEKISGDIQPYNDVQLFIKLVDIDVNHKDGIELRDMVKNYNDAIGQLLYKENGIGYKEDGWRPMPIKMYEKEEDFYFGAGLNDAKDNLKTIDDLAIKCDLGEDSILLLKSLLGEEDRKMNLLAGCKARPRIGSLLWHYLYPDRKDEDSDKKEENDFWENLRTEMRDNPAHVMFVGSVFGGTGASGVPTLAKLLKKSMRDNTETGKYAYGVTLMTPYFKLKPKENDYVQSSAFSFESKMALQYYQTDEELTNLNFIQIVGDTPQMMKQKVSKEKDSDVWEEIKYSPDKDGEQNNPCMPAEVVAAIGIHNFFAKKIDVAMKEHELKVHKKEGNAFESLPNEESKRCIKRLERFCHVIAYYDVSAEKGAKPALFTNLWGKELKEGNFVNTYWKEEKNGFGTILNFTDSIYKWLSELDNNGMNDALGLSTTNDTIVEKARKGKTDFLFKDKKASDVTRIMNDETNYFATSAKKEENWSVIRKAAFLNAMLKVCGSDSGKESK